MTDEQARQRLSNESGASSPHDTPTRQEMLGGRKKRLEQIRARADEARALRARECKLEVQLIAADVERNALFRKGGIDVDPAKAAEISEALAQKHELQARLETLRRQAAQSDAEDSDKLERLRAGRNALRSWLEAPRTLQRARLHPVAHGVLAAAIMGTVWAALAIHLILLVVLFPLCLPLALVAWSRQDLVWLRLGAERRFKATGLAPPMAWEARAVGERVAQIEGLIDEISQRKKDCHASEEMEETELELVTAELAQAEAHLAQVLSEAGLGTDRMDREVERWLALVGEAHRTRDELEQIRAKRAAISAQADNGREELFRFLSRHGQAPREGRADLDTLAAGLDRLADQPSGGQAPRGGPNSEGDS